MIKTIAGRVPARLPLAILWLATLASGCGSEADPSQWQELDVTGWGEVTVRSNARSASVSAQFWSNAMTSRYSYRHVGPCVEVRDAAGPNPDGRETRASAGSLTFTGGAFPWVVTPGAGSAYSAKSDKQFFQGGMVTLQSSGGDVPAFSVSGPAPGYFDVTSPAWNPLLNVLPRGHDLPFTWTGDGIGFVRITLVEGSSIYNSHTVSCDFPNAAGQGTIRTDVLQSVFGDATEAIAYVSSGGSGFEDAARAGEYRVWLTLSGGATWSQESDKQFVIGFAK